MAKEEIIIDVQLTNAGNIEKLAELRKKMDELKKSNKELDLQRKSGVKSDIEARKEIEANNIAYKQLGNELRVLQKGMLDEIATQKNLEGSQKQLSAQLRILTDRWYSMSAAEKEAAEGKELLENLVNTRNELDKVEQAAGNFQRNVGNYPTTLNLSSKSLGELSKMVADFGKTSENTGFSVTAGFKSMGGSVSQFGKTLLTTPVGWITIGLKVLMAIIDQLKESFKKSDDAGTSMATAFDNFKPILQAINDLFRWSVEQISKFVVAIAKLTGAIVGFFTTTKSESADLLRQISIDIDKLEEVERDYVVNSAKRDAEISELRAKARDTETFTAKEREKMLKDAIELEKQNLEDEKKIVAEKVRLLELEAKANSDTSDETANKIAQARAEMFKAEKSYNDGMRRLSRELISARKEQADEEKKIHDDALRRIEERTSKEVAAIRQMQDLLIQQYEDATTMAVAQEQIRAAREIEDLKKRLSTEKDLTLKARQAIEESISLIAENSQAKIDALYDAASEKKFNDEIQKEQNKISLLLEIAEKGSENEYNLKIEQIELLRKKEIEAAEKTGADINLINEKFNLQIAEADKQRIILTEKEKKQALENSYNEARLNFQGHLEELAQIEIDKANENHNYLVNLDEETKKALFESDAAYTAALLQSKEEIFNAEQKILQIQQQSFESQVKSIQTFGSTISDVLGEIAGDSKEFLVFQKLIALANASLNLATAISAATSSSTVGDPYTMAARIVANVGAVVASFIQVTKSIKQANVPDVPRFEKGVNAGVVPGNSFSGDKVLIRVNSGETILTRDQKDNLIKSMANGVAQVSFDYELFSNILAQKIKEIPAPVLDYKEFTNFVNNKVRFDEYANI